MRQAIEERMENQIMKARVYNAIFDVAVAAVEEASSGTASQVSDNQFNVNIENLSISTVCYDSDYSVITVGIDYQTTEVNTRVADLSINIDGTYEENYHSIPRAIRATVFNIIDNVIDEVTSIIDSYDPNAVSSGDSEQ